MGELGNFGPFLKDYGGNLGKNGKNPYLRITTHDMDLVDSPRKPFFLIVFDTLCPTQTLRNGLKVEFSFLFLDNN